MVFPNSSALCKKDSAWIIYLVYEQYYDVHFQICYAPIGFTKIYSSCAYPDKKTSKNQVRKEFLVI